jgi:hypothetical protein
MSGDLGEASVPGTLIFIAGLGSSHNVFFALPLAKQTSSGLDALGLCSWVCLPAFNLGRDLPQAAATSGTEPARGLFLQSVGEDPNQQLPPYAERNGLLDQLTPELAKSRFIHFRQRFQAFREVHIRPESPVLQHSQ